jgi:glycosyltransferase involved in cell wall biosynthesis
MPRVTVVIPTYNSESFIAETLESVRAQTLRDFEVVLVDDGSRDSTVPIASRFAGEMDLRIITQANAGPSAARNNGIRSARGGYCAFVDADDLMQPQRLAEQVAMLDADPQLAAVHTDLMTFDDNGIIHQTRRAFSNPCGGQILDRLLLDNFITTSTVMARTERLIEVGLFDENRRLSEDFDLWLRVAERWPIGFIEHPLTRYRRRPGSLSDDKLKTGLSALQVIEQFWRTHPEYRRRHPDVWRRSLARHLCIAGAAASTQRKALPALRYLLRSLRHESGNIDAWKWLAKTTLAPLRPAPAQARSA